MAGAGGSGRDRFNDEWTDESWDAVWESAVRVDEGGLSIEMRRPYSQLRFPAADRHSFGINALRYIQRRKERAWLVHVPRTESGCIFRWESRRGSAMYLIWSDQREDLANPRPFDFGATSAVSSAARLTRRPLPGGVLVSAGRSLVYPQTLSVAEPA